MDFDDTPEDAAFRAELRAWLAANHPGPLPGDADDAFEFRRAWQRRLADAGWVAPGWPRAWGGREASVAQRVIYQEELAEARAPTVINSIGVWNIGPAILEYGTDEQLQRWLPPMLAADEIWCQGFSEPSAGSDLAALATRAERDGDAYVITGQKVWISRANRSDRCLLLCRSDPSEQRHRGMSMIVVDMRAPGVEVRPLREITGGTEFNEVFFTEVRAPVVDRLGDEGDGWRVAMATLTHERVGTVTYGINLRQRLEQLLAHEESWPSDPVRAAALQQELADLYVRVQIIRLTALRAVTKAARGDDPWPEVPIGKLHWSLVSQDLAEAAMHAFGPDGLRWKGDADAIDDGSWAHDEVWSRMTTIGAGTTEIQKNILAERALGLPRG
ncbi:MAG TPA: acyl-CoA dehydrogenase family protein [Actinomycetota bacterium]